jgi:cobalamin biosynthesis protein CobW
MSAQRIPATVITGFLGSGKTTLIRHLLANANGRRIALIINEFGDVGVDGEILKSCGGETCNEDDIIELSNGCICCTVAEEFIPTMKTLLDRASPPEQIVIETSGLALPQPLVRAFNWPEIRVRVTVDGVITVVDAKALAEGRFADNEGALSAQRGRGPGIDHENPIEELFEDQLNCADMVVLNKTDLVSAECFSALAQVLKTKIRPGASLLAAAHGAIDTSVLLGIAAEAESNLETRRSHHELEGEVQHDHDEFETFVVSLDEITNAATLLTRVERAMIEHDILRLKGFVDLKGSPGRMLIQAVGPRVNHYFDRPWKAGENRRTELVVIGEKGMDHKAIEHLLKG